MVLSYYIYKYPYKLAWHIAKLFGKTCEVVFYCGTPLDYVVFEQVQKHLPEMPIVAKDKNTADFLKSVGINPLKMPVFPRKVVMARQVAHKFPEKKINIITMSHGTSRFKKIKANHFHNVNLTLETGQHAVDKIKDIGFKKAVAVGFPKLDLAFNGTYTADYIAELKNRIGIDPAKKTLLFTATWDGSGMSAIDKWYGQLYEFTGKYNVLVTIHSWCSKQYRDKIKATKSVVYIDSPFILDYLMIADVMIGDMSSILAEFCALNKPMITFAVDSAKRTQSDVEVMMKDISVQIDDLSELLPTIEHSIAHPTEKEPERMKYNQKLFFALDGRAGQRAAEYIRLI